MCDNEIDITCLEKDEDYYYPDMLLALEESTGLPKEILRIIMTMALDLEKQDFDSTVRARGGD